MDPVDLLCIGGSSTDIILRVDRLPAAGEKALAQLIGRQRKNIRYQPAVIKGIQAFKSALIMYRPHRSQTLGVQT